MLEIDIRDCESRIRGFVKLLDAMIDSEDEHPVFDLSMREKAKLLAGEGMQAVALLTVQAEDREHWGKPAYDPDQYEDSEDLDELELENMTGGSSDWTPETVMEAIIFLDNLLDEIRRLMV